MFLFWHVRGFGNLSFTIKKDRHYGALAH